MVALALPAGRTYSAEGMTLARALERARERSPEILAARQDLVVARGHLEKARYWNPFNPEIEGGAAERRFDAGGSAVQPSGAISIEIEVGGQRKKRIEEAERNLARIEAEIANVERDVLAEVAESFYRAAYSLRRVDLFHKVEALNARLRDAALERFNSGEASKLDANLGVVRYAEARRQTLAADRDYRNAVRGLERRIGAEPLGTTEIVAGISIRPPRSPKRLSSTPPCACGRTFERVEKKSHASMRMWLSRAGWSCRTRRWPEPTRRRPSRREAATESSVERYEFRSRSSIARAPS